MLALLPAVKSPRRQAAGEEQGAERAAQRRAGQDVAGHDVQFAGQLPDERRVGAGAEAVPMEKMCRVAGTPPVEEVQPAAGDGEVPFGGFGWVR